MHKMILKSYEEGTNKFHKGAALTMFFLMILVGKALKKKLAQLVPLSIHVTLAICCNRRQEKVSMPKYSLMNNETGTLFLESS